MRPLFPGRLKELPPIDWERLQSFGDSALVVGDRILHYLINKLPAAERVLWEVVDGVFGMKQMVKQIVIAAGLQIMLVSGIMFHRTLRKALSAFSHHAARVNELRARLKTAHSYTEWKLVAEELDKVEGADIWRKVPESKLYDYRVLRRSIDEINTLIANGDVFHLMFRLRGSLNRAQFGMLHEGLFSRAHAGTKLLVEEYQDAVVAALNYTADSETDIAEIPTEAKLAFFNETRHAYGRTGLLLSGGAAMGFYHVGVVKALFDANLLPRVLSGASAGSLLISIIGSRTDEELTFMFEGKQMRMDFFRLARSSRPQEDTIKKLQFAIPQSLRWLSDLFISLLVDREGVLKMDTEYFKRCVQENTGSYTFQEAFDRTGRIINITVAPKNNYDPPRLLNYLTAPHVLVWSAGVASCAVPGIFDACPLLVREPDGSIRPEDTGSTGTAVPTWSDGSVEADLPMQQLSELFNVNHFIVSQVNPHALLLSTLSFSPSVWNNPVYGLLMGTLKFVKTATRDWVRNVVEFILFRRTAPTWGVRRGLTQVLTQEYVGRDCDVTIMPWKGHISVFSAIVGLLRNISPEDFHDMSAVSERNTWPHMSRIRSHCIVEVCLEKCVQRLRKRVLQESIERDIQKALLSKGRGALKDRVPSFYTSPSLINLSGLSVADPVVIDHRPRERRSNTSLASMGDVSPDLAVDSHAPQFVSQVPAQGEEEEQEEEDVGLPTNPSAEDVQELARQTAADVIRKRGPGIMKSTSMANFYYRRSHSDEQLNVNEEAGGANPTTAATSPPGRRPSNATPAPRRQSSEPFVNNV